MSRRVTFVTVSDVDRILAVINELNIKELKIEEVNLNAPKESIGGAE